MQRDIHHQWFFPHPPGVVWEHLTQPALLAQWLMENDFRPEVGHRFRFRATPKVKLGFDGNIYCEVLEVVPRRRLSYSWRGGAGPERITLDSVVVWTLLAKDGGTELTLEHRGFRGVKNYLAYVIMSRGWAKIGKRLQNQAP